MYSAGSLSFALPPHLLRIPIHEEVSGDEAPARTRREGGAE
jgi:hypothetical protein